MSIKKAELLRLIDKAHRSEEDAVFNISKHIESAIQWLPASPEETKNILDALNKLSRESVGHSAILTKLKKQVQEDTRDVF